MLYTPHFLVGALVLKYVPDPKIGIPMALLSHIILDLMPHNDFDLKPGITLKEFFNMERRKRNIILTALSFDYLLTGLSFIFIFLKFNNYWFLLGGIAGVFPDLVEQILMLFGIPLPGWQDKLQFRVSAKYGFIYYPIVSFLAVYFLLK